MVLYAKRRVLEMTLKSKRKNITSRSSRNRLRKARVSEPCNCNSEKSIVTPHIVNFPLALNFHNCKLSVESFLSVDRKSKRVLVQTHAEDPQRASWLCNSQLQHQTRASGSSRFGSVAFHRSLFFCLHCVESSEVSRVSSTMDVKCHDYHIIIARPINSKAYWFTHPAEMRGNVEL